MELHNKHDIWILEQDKQVWEDKYEPDLQAKQPEELHNIQLSITDEHN